jgi:deoxyadenosine/deoxycytidine kinase
MTTETRGAIIAVEGLIGAGKSTLCQYIRRRSETIVYNEATSPLMCEYKKEPARWALSMQIDLFTNRLTMLRSARRLAQSGSACVLDRSILGDRAFAEANWREGWMTPTEYRIYCDLYEESLIYAPMPDIVVYLDVSAETAIKRADRRDDGTRPPLSYQTALKNAHLELLNDYESRGVHVWRAPWETDHEGARYTVEADFLLTRLFRDLNGVLVE